MSPTVRTESFSDVVLYDPEALAGFPAGKRSPPPSLRANSTRLRRALRRANAMQLPWRSAERESVEFEVRVEESADDSPVRLWRRRLPPTRRRPAADYFGFTSAQTRVSAR